MTITPVPTANHGTYYRYKSGCRCSHCTEANRLRSRRQRAGIVGRPAGRPRLDAPSIEPDVAPIWLLERFPVALVARQMFPKDRAAIAAAFSTGVGFAAAADPGSAARPVPTSAGDRAGRAQTDGGVR